MKELISVSRIAYRPLTSFIFNFYSGCDDVAPEGVGFYDALVKPLRVKPEGVPVEIVQSDFKCIESGNDK